MPVVCKKDECCGKKGICIHEKIMLGVLALLGFCAITYGLLNLYFLGLL